MKKQIEDKRNQRLFEITEEVQTKKLVDEFINELGKRDDANAQWFAIQYRILTMNKSLSRQLNLIILQLLFLAILGFVLSLQLLRP